MNCFRCGEEIREPAGYICEPCLDQVDEGVVVLTQEEIEDRKRKEAGEIELLPREAIIAMLNGETLTLGGHPVEEKWDGNNFVYRVLGEKGWHLKPVDGKFVNLFFKKPPNKTSSMSRFECLAWVSSPESSGWMVSMKTKHDGDWRPWDIPQRFIFDGDEGYKISFDYVSYRRARVLPDGSGIDESSIQVFVIK